MYNVYKKVKDVGINTGVVIDTAHIYGSGCNISNLHEMKEFFEKLIEYIPAKDILIHLNDAQHSLGSGKDIHASLTEGNIFKSEKGRESLKWLISFIKKYNIDTTLRKK